MVYRQSDILQLGVMAEIEAQMFSFQKSSIEELPMNLALNPPFCQTAVGCSIILVCWLSVHFEFVQLSSSYFFLRLDTFFAMKVLPNVQVS